MNLAYQGKCEKSIDFWGMITDPIGEMIEMVAQLIMSAALSVFGNPMDIPSKNDATSYEIAGETRWIVVYLAIGSMLFAAVRMALERRGEAGQTALKGVLRVLLVSSAASTVIGTFIVLMDEYSGYLLKDALDKLMGGINCSSNVESMLLLVIGCLLLISAIIHTLLMWIRLGVMIMLMGTLPMAAAASMTDWGGTWWRKHLGWLIAWLLYKPTVALLIWSGSVMVDQSTADQTHTQIAGMGTLLLTAVALPALMRIIVPAVGALGGDSAGSATMGVAGGLASGAKSLAGPGGASGGGGSGGSPSGPPGAGGGPGGQGSAGANGGPGSSGSGGSPGSGGGFGGGPGGGGGGGKAGAANPALTAALGAAEVAGKVAKGAVDVAKSGVEGANQDDGR